MLTVCCSIARVGELTVTVALKWDASLLMLMDVVVVLGSPPPAGLLAMVVARAVRGEAGTGQMVRRGALGLVGDEPCCSSVDRGEQGIMGAGLQDEETWIGLHACSV